MGRLVHLGIHVEDMERAKKFYGEVFGWSFQDWSDFAGMPYLGAWLEMRMNLGNGALMQGQSPPPEAVQALNRYACTMGVDNYYEAEALFLDILW